MIQVEDPKRLSPPQFPQALTDCFGKLPFELKKPVRVVVQANPGKGWPKSKFHLATGDEWTLTLNADDINAEVMSARLYYWLLLTLEELAHVHFMEKIPATRGSDEDCRKLAEGLILHYKQDWFK